MSTAPSNHLGSIGNFHLVEETAVNPFGSTMRAQHRFLKGLMVSIHLYDDPAFIKNLRTLREISPITGHGSIIRLEDFNPELEHPYFVSELISGRSLRSHLEERGAFPFDEGFQIFSQLLGAVRFAHARGMVHENLNPDNVYLTGGGDVKVFGFGIGRIAMKTALEYLDTRQTANGRSLKKIFKYKTKNQKTGGTADVRDDVFALGIIFHEILTGSFPRRQTLPTDLVPEMPKTVNKIYARCCTRPERRYNSVKHLQEEIEQLREQLPPSSTSEVGSQQVMFGSGYHEIMSNAGEDGGTETPDGTDSEIQRAQQLLPSLQLIKKKVAFVSMAEMCGTRNAIDEKSLPNIEGNIEFLRTLNLLSYAFDFSEITYVSSSGLSYLVNSSDEIKNHGGEAIIYSITPKIRQILDVLGLETFFDTFDDEASARQHFARKF